MFHQFLPHGTQILLSSSHFDAIHVYGEEHTLFSMKKTDIANSVLFFVIQAPAELPRSVFSTQGLRVSVRANLVQEEPLVLQCLTKISSMYVVADVSINLDNLTLEF